jgi:hypothetical protein
MEILEILKGYKIMKKTILLLIIVSLIAVPAFGKGKGIVPKPGQPTVDVNGDVVIDWEPTTIPTDPNTTAVKWSVDIEGTATYSDGVAPDPNTIDDIEVSLGTSDYPDAVGGMIESKLTIDKDELMDLIAAAIAEQLGLLPEDITLDSFEGMVKVKGLDPGKGKGRQNNEFSDPSPISLP